MSTSDASPPLPRIDRRNAYYERDVDFDDLARRDADFAVLAHKAKQAGWMDFQDPKVVQQLTLSLLRADFSLTLTLPSDRLCPPVPVRWNYIRWIQQLLDSTAPSPDYSSTYDPSRRVLGLDIGTGASCIYPLLATSTRPGWRMLGTDIDARSLEYAEKNVRLNGLEGRIALRLTGEEEGLVQFVDSSSSTSCSPPTSDNDEAIRGLSGAKLDFILTNPPFYASPSEIALSHSLKASASGPPSAVCSGSPNEMLYPDGGDYGFATRILRESLLLRSRVQWYTVMFGRLASAQNFVDRLKADGITNFAAVNLAPGAKTRRWGVGWSFGDRRPEPEVARCGEVGARLAPWGCAGRVLMQGEGGVKEVGERVCEAMRGLDVRWTWRPLEGVGVMECGGNVWSRAMRRKKKKFAAMVEEEDDQGEVDEVEEPKAVALAVKVTCKADGVDLRWLRGHDKMLWESFCGVLRRKLVGHV